MRSAILCCVLGVIVQASLSMVGLSLFVRRNLGVSVVVAGSENLTMKAKWRFAGDQNKHHIKDLSTILHGLLTSIIETLVLLKQRSEVL